MSSTSDSLHFDSIRPRIIALAHGQYCLEKSLMGRKITLNPQDPRKAVTLKVSALMGEIESLIKTEQISRFDCKKLADLVVRLTSDPQLKSERNVQNIVRALQEVLHKERLRTPQASLDRLSQVADKIENREIMDLSPQDINELAEVRRLQRQGEAESLIKKIDKVLNDKAGKRVDVQRKKIEAALMEGAPIDGLLQEVARDFSKFKLVLPKKLFNENVNRLWQQILAPLEMRARLNKNNEKPDLAEGIPDLHQMQLLEEALREISPDVMQNPYEKCRYLLQAIEQRAKSLASGMQTLITSKERLTSEQKREVAHLVDHSAQVLDKEGSIIRGLLVRNRRELGIIEKYYIEAKAEAMLHAAREGQPIGPLVVGAKRAFVWLGGKGRDINVERRLWDAFLHLMPSEKEGEGVRQRMLICALENFSMVPPNSRRALLEEAVKLGSRDIQQALLKAKADLLIEAYFSPFISQELAANLALLTVSDTALKDRPALVINALNGFEKLNVAEREQLLKDALLLKKRENSKALNEALSQVTVDLLFEAYTRFPPSQELVGILDLLGIPKTAVTNQGELKSWLIQKSWEHRINFDKPTPIVDMPQEDKSVQSAKMSKAGPVAALGGVIPPIADQEPKELLRLKEYFLKITPFIPDEIDDAGVKIKKAALINKVCEKLDSLSKSQYSDAYGKSSEFEQLQTLTSGLLHFLAHLDKEMVAIDKAMPDEREKLQRDFDVEVMQVFTEQLGLAFFHCTDRMITEVTRVYAERCGAEGTQNMTFPDRVNSWLTAKRQAILEAVVVDLFKGRHGDIASTVAYYQDIFAQELGIPKAGAAYVGVALRGQEAVIRQKFWEAYNATDLIHEVTQMLSKATAPFNTRIGIDFLTEKISNFDEEKQQYLLDESFIHPADVFGFMLLQELGVLAPLGGTGMESRKLFNEYQAVQPLTSPPPQAVVSAPSSVAAVRIPRGGPLRTEFWHAYAIIERLFRTEPDYETCVRVQEYLDSHGLTDQLYERERQHVRLATPLLTAIREIIVGEHRDNIRALLEI